MTTALPDALFALAQANFVAGSEFGYVACHFADVRLTRVLSFIALSSFLLNARVTCNSNRCCVDRQIGIILLVEDDQV